MPTDTAGCPAPSSTRCRTEGSSRCPGCSCDGYYTVPCKVHRCVREKGLDHCGQCGDFPCPKLGKMGDFRDLDTGRVKERRACRAVAAEGLPAWLAEYEEGAEPADGGAGAVQQRQDEAVSLRAVPAAATLDTLRRIMARAEALEGGRFQGAGPGLPGAGGGDAGIVSGALNRKKPPEHLLRWL